MLAYLDPGTGSILIQVLIAAVVTIATLGRSYILRPVRWLFGKPPAEEPPPDQ